MVVKTLARNIYLFYEYRFERNKKATVIVTIKLTLVILYFSLKNLLIK